MLSFYAIQNTEDITPNTINDQLMLVDSKYFSTTTHFSLVNKNLLVRNKYNFMLNELTYSIAPDVMVPTIIWLYNSEEGKDILKVLRKAYNKFDNSSTSLQITITDYIKSDFKNTQSVNTIFSTDVKYLISTIEDSRFISFFSHMNESPFAELIKSAISKSYATGKTIDCTRLRTLISSRTYHSISTKEELEAIVSLYAYLVEGATPNTTKHNSDTILILSAIRKLYEGNYEASLKAFRSAMSIHNANISIATNRGFFAEPIFNFLYVVCSYKEGTAEGQKNIAFMLKQRKDNECTKAAQVLAAALTNQKGYVSQLRLSFTNASYMTKQLLLLITRLLGRNDIVTDEAYELYEPTWLILRYEYDKYSPLDYKILEKAKAAYKAPQLSSIYVKQQWEYVLESLSRKSTGKESTPERTERIAYFMRNITDDHCEIRQQTILKNGTWSSGKTISLSTFYNMHESQLSLSDIKIRNRCRETSAFSHVQLNDVLELMDRNTTVIYVGYSAPYSIINVVEEMPYLVIERSEMGFSIKSNVPLDYVDDNIIIISRAAASINFLRLSDELRPYFSQLLDLGHFPLEAEDVLKDFLEGLRGKVEVHSTLIKGGTTLDTVQGKPCITLQMRPQGKEAYVVSIFCRALPEGMVQNVPGEGSSVVVDMQDNHRVCVERNLERERELMDLLVNGVEGGLPDNSSFQVDAFGLLPILDFVRNNKEDFVIEWPEGQKLNLRNRYTASQWRATIKKNKNGWFEMEGNVQIDENTVLSMAQLMELVNSSRGRYIRLEEGEYIALSERLRRQLYALDALASRSRNKLQISPFSAALIDNSLTNGELMLDIDDELQEIRQRILDSSNYCPDVPDTLNATLRSYQKEGYQWIARLNSWGAGALLADDMGLGKTIQTIAYLLSKAEEGPALVVAPASVAPNWKTEFDKFAPSLNVHILNFAQNRSACIADAKAGDVIITTYGLLLSVKTEITQKEWITVCLDEAHVIKNRGAKTSGVAMQLKSKYRIMLTGTPLQNHLGELWNLFQFVNPGLLGSYEDFGRRFITPIEVGKDKERQKELERIVHPFMLRRTKDNVLSELPEKTEIYQTVDLTDEEMAVYEIIRKRAEDMLEAEDSEKVSMNTLAEITRLRQAACSAKLIEKTWKGKVSKIEALIEALEPIIDSGDAALVFSQFTSFLSLVQKALQKAGIPFLYIDGSVSVKQRQQLVESFQKGECPVFIISLKAGGLGLNLTRANYVFHLDPWWNPAIEQQATDRAHRMGQHNAVTVYHFLATNTIEEKIRRMHEQKRNLADNILEGTEASSKLTGKDLLELLKNK